MPGVEGGFLVQKLQIFAVRAEGRFRLGLIRNAGHLPGGLFKKAEPDYVCLITPPPAQFPGLRATAAVAA